MRRLSALVALFALVAPTTAAADWLSLRSDHFQVIGNASEADLRNVALRPEQFREVVSHPSPTILRDGNAPPVVVMVFKDKSSYQPFSPLRDGRVDPGTVGYFLPGQDVNYITLTLQFSYQGYEVIFHELSHLILDGVFADAPLWFNEGLAEYYSTVEISGTRAKIGKTVLGHLRLLRSRQLPFARFFAIDHNSPEYTKDTIDRAVLYAQSWAIVHHAIHGLSHRRDQLINFVIKMAEGGSTDESFRAAYGIEVRELESELQAYIRQPAHRFVWYDLSDQLITRIGPRATKISDPEADAWLGDLLSRMHRDDEAIARLEQALAASPNLALAHASLGSLLLRRGKTADGMVHLREAQALGTANETAYLAYARGLISLNEPDGLPEAARALERAIELRPGYTEAKLLLAYTYLSLREYTAARDLLTPVVRAERSNHRAALRLAEVLLKLNDIAGARTLLGPVLARSTDADDRQRARTLLEQSAELQTRNQVVADAGVPAVQPSRAGDGRGNTPQRGSTPSFRSVRAGEQRAYGVFQAVECGQNGVVFVVRTANGELRTRAAGFADVEFIAYRALTSQSVNCGAQVPAMEVYLTWRAAPESRPASEGAAVAIELLPEGFVPTP